MWESVTIPTYLIRELPPDKLYALLDILSMADEGGKINASTPELMKRWNWGNTKVRNFINYLLEKDICKQSDKQETNKPTNKKQTIRQTREMLVNTGFINSYQTTIQTRNKQSDKQETNKPTNKKSDFNKEVCKRIIDYMNSRCGTRYTGKNKETIKCIHARLEEKFTEEDFYTVIDKKCNEWIGSEMEKYLRPQTLFGTKFESYLNQNIVKDEKHTGNAYIDTIKNRVSEVDDW